MSLRIQIPELCLVVLIGASGSGKSTFAKRHFKPTEVLSSDICRGWVSDDDNNQAATPDAFAVLQFIARKRLERGLLTVIDATNVRPEDRKVYVSLAREYHVLPVAIVLDTPIDQCLERNRARPDRTFGPHVVRNQTAALKRSLRGLDQEGFRRVHVLGPPVDLESLQIERERVWNNLKHLHGPFDIIGDVHGCAAELDQLLEKLGYRNDGAGHAHPDGRQAVFVGDLVDRGPDSPGVIKRVQAMIARGSAQCVAGNHDVKLARALNGGNVKLSHGLAESLDQMALESPEFRAEATTFLDQLVSHYVFDDGKLVVAHAGLKESMHGRTSGAVRSFCLYGETSGETDEYGLPVRYHWALDYRGRALVVYGHTPVPQAEWINGTICIDTACVFGGRLTALRYPERELVDVPAAREYYAPLRPFGLGPAKPERPAQAASDDRLALSDLSGKRIIETRYLPPITIRAEQAAAALEGLSRFAIDPRWLIHLPPTMAPPETHVGDGFLEHPEQAFEAYRRDGVHALVCEEKHMGSRAIIVVCRDPSIATLRFGVEQPALGAIYTRTGRAFFSKSGWTETLLERTRAAIERAGWWGSLQTDWVCLDAELMPWSAKAHELILSQYAQVGVAAQARARGLRRALGLTEPTIREQLPVEWQGQHAEDIDRYVAAYRRYAPPVHSIDDLKIAPFHLLASEGQVHADKPHRWHLERLAELSSPSIQATDYREVDLDDPASVQAAIDWWLTITEAGSEGMVIKPAQFLQRGATRIVQPAIKCRGREYLRIIYGPQYLEPNNLERLRKRQVGAKRSLAMREFALGLEALDRFVAREPLRRVHECVFGVLALESEPVDPRL
jgi:protein phosphatase